MRRLSTLGLFVFLGCYDTGEGQTPPRSELYFPVGLAVSPGGRTLYVVNSDFDLQYSGGTLQAYDLAQIRADALATTKKQPGGCAGDPNNPKIGLVCAPPTRSETYFRHGVTIGAFATDLLLSRVGFSSATVGAARRLYTPVRGNASVTWFDIPDDSVATPADPFQISCGASGDGARCSSSHEAGNNPLEPGNTRGVTMPGEPFGITESERGDSLLVTHQDSDKMSLFSSGIGVTGAPEPASLQFILAELPRGGVGIASIPHDAEAFSTGLASRPAFLTTSRVSTDVTLVRYFADGKEGESSSLRRPFLVKEGSFRITANAAGTDSRSIVTDPSPRIACKARVKPSDSSLVPPRTEDDVKQERARCARLPARVFMANRSPASLLVGEVGDADATTEDGYNPDSFRLTESIPLAQGPSKLYLAPIVERDGKLALRLFIVCYDAGSVFVYDPEARIVENIVRLGPSPFAMAFDPFKFEDAVLHASVPKANGQHTFRYGYIASFTHSYMQVIDLDNASDDPSSFEQVVFTLGEPHAPKGSN